MSRILVIDDDPIYREMIVDALQAEGYETLHAENGEVGIERARAYVPDLVISDVVMEKADGYQVLATLRAEPATAAIPFIMITGWSSKGGQRQGMAMGADDYLAKPFNATELLQSVSAQLRKKERSIVRAATRSTAADSALTTILPAEISKPLQTIQGFAAILRRDSTSLGKGEIGEIARHIQTSALRIRRSVDNYIVFAELGMLEEDADRAAALRRDRIDGLQSLIEVRSRNLARAVEREPDLKFDCRDGSAAISETYFGRVLDELVDNALKFSPPGSPVEITAAFKADRFGFAVRDHGLGMTPESVASVDAFVQFSRAEYGQAGMGLGLAIARRIVNLHGGVLTLKSRVGEGTRVLVELPR